MLDCGSLFFFPETVLVLDTSVKYCCVLGLPAANHHSNAVKWTTVKFSSCSSIFSCVSAVWYLALLFCFCCSSSTHRAHLDFCSSVTPCSGEESQPAWHWCGCSCGQHICVFLQYFCSSALGHVPISACTERCCRNTACLGLEGTLNIT